MRQEKEELMEEGSQSASGASGVFLQCLGRPGAGWSRASQPRPLLSVPGPKRGPMGLEGNLRFPDPQVWERFAFISTERVDRAFPP